MTAPQKILIVDDRPANLFALRSLLSHLQVEIVESRSGEEALKETLNHSFALTILDVQMPGMNGYEVAELMRSSEATENTPIIFMSAAYSDDIHIFKGYEAGGIDFIPKPYNPDILLGKVQIFLELDLHRRHLEETIARRTAELRQANEQQAALLEQCRQAERRYRQLAVVVEQSADAIMITDTSQRITYVNSAFEQITGYTAAEMMGQVPGVLSGQYLPAEVHRAIQHHLSAGVVWSDQVTDRRKDGSRYAADLRLSPVRDENGAVVHYVATLRDVTKEADLAVQLSQAQKMEAIGQLAGGVAHDFNNLLTIILGQTQLLQLKLARTGTYKNNLDSIQQAANRAAALTRQLLAFSRKSVIRVQVFDINYTMNDLLKMLRRLIGEDIALTTELCEEPCRIKADPGQFEQALMNLVVNARDAMPQGGALVIRTGIARTADIGFDGRLTREADTCAMISVTDTGCGMSEEIQARIFEPFFTTKESGKGTGLGLAMVYGAVTQFHGHVKVISEVGKGSTFTLYFPLCQEDADREEIVDKLTTPGSGETILVTEDEPELRQLCREVLAGQNFRVLLAADATEALQLAESCPGKIDLLLTDLIMPGMFGIELAKAIKLIHPGVEVVYMSGYTDRVSHELGIDLDKNFLQKPFSPRTLIDKLNSVLSPAQPA